MELPKRYDPKQGEAKWQKYWEDNKTYSFDANDTKREIFSIDTPPPTVSGKMHMGHAFGNSQQDFIARFKRMQGFNVLQPFGTDDNGLPTQLLIEKLKKVRAKNMPRKDFVKLCLETLEKELRPSYTADWKALGISCDFDVFYTTINDHCRKLSQWSFIDLYKRKRAYRKRSPIIVCPKCQTSIAQVELEDRKQSSALNYIKAKVEGEEFLVFATTRPEVIFGNVGMSLHEDGDYVKVNKDGERWILSKDAADSFKEEWDLKDISKPFKGKELIGKKVTVPLIDRELPITHDEITRTDFGTGFVYYCTYGGIDCIEWMDRHPDVEPIDVMGTNGRYNDLAGEFAGKTSKQARPLVVEALEKLGVLVKEEPIEHVVNTHERCGTEIEFVREKQWSIKVLDLKDKWLELGNDLKWFPNHMKNRYDNWANGLKWDWNISRQIFFGVPFPVWYCEKCEEPVMAEEKDLPVDPLHDKAPIKECPKCKHTKFLPEDDIINTWATSSLTPTIVKELFKGKPVYEKLVSSPMSLRPQGHDIISFWLFNTVIKSHLHYDMIPWDDCFINGWMLDPKGRKMSKSKGNVVEPQKMIEKYSADALRFMSAGCKLGEDFPFQEKDLVTGIKFTNKLWNASKFSLMHLEDYKPGKVNETFDKWLLSKLQRVIKVSTQTFEKYEFSKPKAEVEKFFWQAFCDQYLEIVKDRLYNPEVRGVQARESAQQALYSSVLAVLKMMAPITPHICEEIYQLFFASKEGMKSVHLSSWPSFDEKLVDEKAEEAGDLGVEIISAVRKFKSEEQMSLKDELSSLVLVSSKDGFEELVRSVEADLKSVLRVKEIVFSGETSLELSNGEVKLGIVK